MKLRHFAGVSEAGARSPNPEQREGSDFTNPLRSAILGPEVTQGVADEVERQHGQHHREGWGNYQVGRVEEVKPRPSLSMVPQLAVGGGTPSPRKLMVASARMAPAMPIAACTMMG